jgi:hypothetical protein
MNYENTRRNQPDYISTHTKSKSATSTQTGVLQLEQLSCLRSMYIK